MGIAGLAISFGRVQQAEGKSPLTIRLYAVCIARLVRFLEAETGSDDASGLTRRHMTDFYAVRAATAAPSTVSIDFRVHRVFLCWCVEEGEMAVNPMDRMRQPRVPITPVPTMTDEDLRFAHPSVGRRANHRGRLGLSVMRTGVWRLLDRRRGGSRRAPAAGGEGDDR